MSEPLELIALGEILLEEFMRPHAISQDRLSSEIEVPVARINGSVKGKRGALRIARYFGTSAEFWLGLQEESNIRRARRNIRSAIEPRVRSLTAA